MILGLWKLSWAQNRERGEIKLRYCWMDWHSKSSSSWIATDGQSHPNQAMFGGHRVMQDLLSRSDRSCLCCSHPMCTVKLKGKLSTATTPGPLNVWQAWQTPLTISKVLFGTPWSEAQDIPNVLVGFAASGQNSPHCQSGCLKISKK